MRYFLWKNDSVLSRLPCNEIILDLEAYHLITHYENLTMDSYQGHPNPLSTALQTIHRNPYSKRPKMFKTLLQVMERSGIQVLQKTAEELGQ